MSSSPLLPSIKPRSWDPEWLPEGWTVGERYVSTSATAPFEVVVAHATATPRVADATRVWKARHGGKALDVLLVVMHRETALVVGSSDTTHRSEVPRGRVAACCTQAMEATSPTALRSALEPLFADGPSAAEGLTNKGLFATYALTNFSKRHPDAWARATEKSQGVRERSGTDILTHLGWSVGMHGDAYVLRTDDEAHAVAVLLEGDEVFDRPSLRFGLGTSPVEHALSVATKQKVAWVQAVQGRRIRLYPVPHDLGIRRTGVTSYTEIDLTHLADDELGYAALLLSPEALRTDGTAFQIVQESRLRATNLGERLRERIYDDVVPKLAEAVAQRTTPAGEALDERGLADAYHRTLVIIFRTLFVAYAEDRELLPLDGPHAAGYSRVALKNRAREWAESDLDFAESDFSDTATDLWDDLRAIWSAVHGGSREWGIPAYGGSLFDDSLDDRPTLARLTLVNSEIGPALRAMLVDKDIDDEPGPVDFGALSVREFGTIYEGLLESSLSTAPVDLTLDAEQTYVPAGNGDEIKVRAGDVYFHNASGARKATGSYFTKDFAVEHLLTTALQPTLDEHLDAVAALLESGRTADAAAKFFDFRVADIAMGSGHFIVGALDVMARRMSVFLADHPIDTVTRELDMLRTEALRALDSVGRTADDIALSQEALLRRQLAKRCLYGVDINLVAVELARLALWIHTFVPGLPMSSLDQHLVHGNSLTGIATTNELLEILEPGATSTAADGVVQSIFRDDIIEGQRRASATLSRAALLSEATIAETVLAEQIRAEAASDLVPVRAAYDVAFASRLRETFPEDQLPDVRTVAAIGPEAFTTAAGRPAVRALVDDLRPVHFPVAFPEVFDRDRPGFDVVLGNPPWEKVKVEEHGWWGLRFPGLRSMPQREKNASIARYRAERPDLVANYDQDVASAVILRAVFRAGPYALGNGDTDLYKVFCWRDWVLLRERGRAGVVFPRGALSGSGTAAWREDVIEHGAFDAVTFLTNTREWVFETVHPQYTVGLTTIRRGGYSLVRFNGPFHSQREFDEGSDSYLSVDGMEFRSWSSGTAFPLLPSATSASIFARLRRSPRFDAQTIFRAVAELHATADKRFMHFERHSASTSTVPILAGKSFNLWDPDFGEAYATADRSELEHHLLTKRLRQARTSSSAFFGLPATSPEDLPLARARIAFRDVARSTDTRTIIAALIPPGYALVHNAPFLLQREDRPKDEAFLLGVLGSIPLDWTARRSVETHVTFDVLNALPIPRPEPDSPLRRRVVEISGRLAAVDERFADWAAEVGVPVGSVTDEVMKDDLVAELDALVALLYELDRDDVVHIFETFHRGWDYRPRLEAVLAHFDRWSAA